jgi:hypothetical protein
MKVLFINTGDNYEISSNVEKFDLKDVLDKKNNCFLNCKSG